MDSVLGLAGKPKLLLVNNGRLLDQKIRVTNKNSSTSKRSRYGVLAESAERLA